MKDTPQHKAKMLLSPSLAEAKRMCSNTGAPNPARETGYSDATATVKETSHLLGQPPPAEAQGCWAPCKPMTVDYMSGKNPSDCSKRFAMICSRLPTIVKMPMYSVLEEKWAQPPGQRD